MANEIVPYQQIEKMAVAVAKSGMFAVKTPEAALTLMMVAQSEGIHPAKAMMEYDLIGGKPSLKSAAMLARFQAAGGKVEWLEASDAKVSGRFSHPQGGSVVVTWDDARVVAAELKNAMHKKFPLQMKRARCISEGVRAVFPGITGLYTSEEQADIAEDATSVPTTVEGKIETFGSGLANAAADFLLQDIANAPDLEALKTAYANAFHEAKQAKDANRIGLFTLAYDERKAALTPPAKTTEEI